MRKKITIGIYVDEEVVRKAKEIGLNISKIAENALKDVIEKISGTNSGNETGPGGLEPPTPGLEGRCSIHAELRAHPRRSTWCEFSSYSLIPV